MTALLLGSPNFPSHTWSPPASPTSGGLTDHLAIPPPPPPPTCSETPALGHRASLQTLLPESGRAPLPLLRLVQPLICPSLLDPPRFPSPAQPPNSNVLKLAKVQSINRPLLESRQNPSKLPFFCDGSRLKQNDKERSGYGVVCYREGEIIESFAMGAGRH